PVRTGVTAIWPHEGNPFQEKVSAASFVLNGFGKTIGLPQIAELGVIETPILLTNTLNVPRVADALISHLIALNPDLASVNGVVGECNDSYLNDIQGRHVGPEHVEEALREAKGGPVVEGAVGAGVGMSCYGFKGGIGTASRRIDLGGATFHLGALVLSNFGRRDELRIDGVPVGRYLADDDFPESSSSAPNPATGPGSIMMIVGTDAPLDARQLARIARRAALGLARTGSPAGHGSGDFVIAFSNGNRVPLRPTGPVLTYCAIAEDGPAITELFQATVESVEEAILNSLFKAETVVGRDGHVREGIPIERVMAIMNARQV
ncbi:MAG TPA: P1 family peptidase, partial [Chloroflexota bacterium]|nr:P1 family peptidase [Chloroflexota bacterium]